MVQFLRDPDTLQGFSGTGLRILLGQTEILRSKAYIRKHIYFKKLMLRILEHQPHLAAKRPLIEACAVNILPIKIDVAAGRLHEPV